MKKALLILFLLGVLIAPVQAQMTRDELLQYAYTAGVGIDSYTSYQAKTTSSEYEQRTIKANGIFVSQISTGKSTESLTTIIRSPAPAAAYNATVTVTQDNSFFTLQGEVRYVNGIVYALAKYLNGTSGATVFPTFWTVVTDANNPGIFNLLRPAGLLQELGVQPDFNPLDNFDTFKALVVDITREDGFSDTGQPVQIIRITLDKRFYETLFASSPLKNYLGAGSEGRYVLYVDALGNVLWSETYFLLQLVNVDASIDPSIPVGNTVDVTTFENRKITLLSVNNAALTVAAP